ncbi:MAG TPA: protein kinase, partial [Blastocatellia bacterium]|nr:protein kinase [Blastocatellia bacterium]
MASTDPAKHLGHYEISSQLGAGGMGEVYLAQDTRLGRSVALKLLPSEFTRDKHRLHRFQREARAASALNHPNILTIFEIGEAKGIHFIAMELIEGQTLKQRMQQKQITLHEALEIATQTSSALASAHQAGIIHRDIKPENIMLRNDGYVKVLDFGLAKLTGLEGVQSEASTMVDTQPGIVLGTMHYMSPEQARGLTVDPRTDIWSLGIVIYEMVSGRMPFEGTTATDVIVAILEHEPAPLAQHERELPDELEWIVRKALRKDRDERYQTSKELLTDLKSLKQRLEFEAQLEQSKPPQLRSGERSEANRKGLDQTTRQLALNTADFEAHRPPSSAEYLLNRLAKRKKSVLGFAAAVILVFAIGILGIYRFVLPRDSNKRVTSLESMKITRVTSTGKASRAAVSPDGKYVVHVANDNGQQSLRLRQLNTASDLQIVPPADTQYLGLTFSPGGDFIYYVAADKNRSTNALYRIPVLGGSPRKLIADVDSGVTVSPDGQQLAFIRDFPSEGERGLIVVKADGSNERKLASRKLPNFFQSVSWSPNGKVLACAAGSFVPNYNSYLVEVDLETGKEKPISSQTWLFMGQVAWLADGSGLIVDASEQGASSFDSNHIWYVSYPGGETHRLTADLNNYSSVSLTADSGRFVAVQSGTTSNIWVVPATDTGRATQITGGAGQRDGWNGLAWTTDDKIIYASKASGNDDLWITNKDGSNQSQLTSGARLN